VRGKLRIYYAHMERASSRPRKVATNLSARADLVRRAKQLGVNLSDVLERALEHAIREREREQWLTDNEDAIDGYNRFVAKHGVFGDDWRKF
jgi:antitoxin CcdA